MAAPAMQAGEYAYHADPYVGAYRATAAKMDKGATSKQPFTAACHSKFAGIFDRIQVCLHSRLLAALPCHLHCLASTRAFAPNYLKSL